MNGRSTLEQVFIRPVNSLTFNTNYFAARVSSAAITRCASAGTGATRTRRRSATAAAIATVRYPTATTNDCTVAATGCQVDLIRDGYSVYDLTNYAAYIQDTITRGRAT